MGSRGPMPTGRAKRRHLDSRPVVISERAAAAGVPDLPPHWTMRSKHTEGRGAQRVVWFETDEYMFSDHAIRAWERVWCSPLASEFRPEMMEGLYRWIRLIDRLWQLGDESVGAEITRLEKEFGLTWESQKRARLSFEDIPVGEAKSPKKSRSSKGGKKDATNVVKFKVAASD